MERFDFKYAIIRGFTIHAVFAKERLLMMNRSSTVLVCLLLAVASSGAQTPSTETKPAAPDINGLWTGSWGTYSSAQGTTPPKDICKKLDAKVEAKGGVWEATFEGDCGRPYKYTIKMEGRLVER